MRISRVLPLFVTMIVLGMSAMPALSVRPDVPQLPVVSAYARSMDAMLGEVSARVPGFGGMYVDHDVLVVYLQDASQAASVPSSVSAVFGAGAVPAGGIRILPAAYSVPQLLGWHGRTGPLFSLPGVVSTDLDEARNRVTVGVVDEASAAAVARELPRLGIPRGAVNIETRAPIVPVATLQDHVRPIEGGLQFAFSIYVCTMSFNGVRAGVAGYVTNSHCTKKQGGVEGTLDYQNSITSANLIGTEIADPDYTLAKCPAGTKGKVCRYSDSAYSERASGVTADQGLIARPTGLGSLTIAGTFRIVSEGPSLVGQTLNKVGRTTGWSQGLVTATCVNTGVQGSKIIQLCQDFVAAAVGGGDSGSPVFAITNSPSANDVQLRGILWGSGGGTFAYSPISNLERADELGPVDSCAPGFTC